MKKIFFSLLVVTLLLGCKAEQPETENIEFEKEQVSEEDSYEYEHGVVGYKFEKWSYDGSDILFDYYINNIRQEAEFGLVFLVDGVSQTYEINEQKTSMFKIKMKSNEKRTFSIKISPKIAENKKICNFNAFLILNPSAQITGEQQYGHNHSISSTATINLELNKNCFSDKIKVESLNTKYDKIPSNILKEYVKNDVNILKDNVYIEYVSSDGNLKDSFSKNDSINLRVFGKKGNYNILVVEDNIITNTYSTSVMENKYSSVTLDLNIKNVANIYFLVVPTDVQDVHEYIMMSQSERYVVK